jgi:hypothetical protein
MNAPRPSGFPGPPTVQLPRTVRVAMTPIAPKAASPSRTIVHGARAAMPTAPVLQSLCSVTAKPGSGDFYASRCHGLWSDCRHTAVRHEFALCVTSRGPMHYRRLLRSRTQPRHRRRLRPTPRGPKWRSKPRNIMVQPVA